MNEASKVRERMLPYLRGRILDIGAGSDPVVPEAEVFDRPQGNAQTVCEPAEAFDTVFSSHCLEHMPRPEEALQNWWALVRPGGHMIIVVPSEDSYEQGVWPSTFNDEHFHSFTLFKHKSWSPATRNLLSMSMMLSMVQIVSAAEVDERPVGAERRDWTQEDRCCHLELVLRKIPSQYSIGTTLDQLIRCPQCRGSVILEGRKGTKAACRCEYCGARADFDLNG